MRFARGFIALSNDPKKDILINDDKFYKIKRLGEYEFSKGGNSSVFSLLDEDGSEKALKISKDPVVKILSNKEKNNLPKAAHYAYSKSSKSNARFLEEIQALRIAKEEGFSNVVETYFDGKIDIEGSQYYYFVMEKADTDLKEHILNNPGMDEQERFKICSEVMTAIKQLHGKAIYHRDIKPDNILLFSSKSEDVKIWKISDLGLISKGERNQLDSIGEKIGPFGWISPEAMNKYLTERAKLGHDCLIDNYSDVFQLGEIFWFVYQGNVPLGQISYEDFICEINRSKEYIFEIIKHMLQHAKSRRLLISDLEEYMKVISHELGL